MILPRKRVGSLIRGKPSAGSVNLHRRVGPGSGHENICNLNPQKYGYFDGDHTSHWGMTKACVVAMLQENNFAVVSNSRDGECGSVLSITPGPDADYYLQISRG